MRVHRLKQHPARAADRFVNRPDGHHAHRQCLDACSEPDRVGYRVFAQQLIEHGGLDAVKVQAAFKVTGKRARAARMPHFDQHLPGRLVGQQVEREGGAAVSAYFVPQQARRGINQAAFNAAGSCDKFASALKRAALRIREMDGDRLEGLAGKAAGKVFRPAGLR